jgi:predicted nucleotide-binding protein
MANQLVDDLHDVTRGLKALVAESEADDVQSPLNRLVRAAERLAEAWSGSSIGFHARVYYANFATPPPGAHFSSEWGFLGQFQGTTGAWQEYAHDAVIAAIEEKAEHADLSRAQAVGRRGRDACDEARAAILSVLSAYLHEREDTYADSLKDKVAGCTPLTEQQALTAQLPHGQITSRDTTALFMGVQSAPHQEVIARVVAIKSIFLTCSELAKLGDRLADHIDRVLSRPSPARVRQGGFVFIGHGRSDQWRQLKDFIQDRLSLPADEFNRVPVAGVTNVERLVQMLHQAGMAFIVLTAEDERVDGVVMARQNVVHEAGLFQGQLGFTRAIVMLEEGCEEFSNIAGLGQIRFPVGRISAAFEEVRRVLEREGFITA